MWVWDVVGVAHTAKLSYSMAISTAAPSAILLESISIEEGLSPAAYSAFAS